MDIKLTPKIKKEAQEVADELGLTLNSLVNAYLKQLVRTKTATFSALEKEPSKYLLKAIKEAEKEIKAGKVGKRFATSDEAIRYLHSLK